MNIFTVEQYDQAIEALQSARKQVVDETQHKGCSVCGSSCHPDFCKFNPLYAMKLCGDVSNQAHDLHQTLHELSGVHTFMGETTGIAKIISPDRWPT